jgi:hypothetical protein
VAVGVVVVGWHESNRLKALTGIPFCRILSQSTKMT